MNVRNATRSEQAGRVTQMEARLRVLRRQAANEPGRLAITDEARIRLLAMAGQGGSY